MTQKEFFRRERLLVIAVLAVFGVLMIYVGSSKPKIGNGPTIQWRTK